MKTYTRTPVLSLRLAALAATAIVLLAQPCRVLAVAAPLNDNFASAFVYTGSLQTGTNIAATTEAGERSLNPASTEAPHHTVWWKYTPLFTGLYRIHTTNSTFDTVLAVYTGTTLKTLVRVASDDQGSTMNTSSLNVKLTKGVTYRIAVGGYDDTTTGTVKLSLTAQRYHTVRTYQVYVPGDNMTLDSAGTITFSVAVTGVLTGKFFLGARSYPFTSAVDEQGAFTAAVSRPGQQTASITGNLGLGSLIDTQGTVVNFENVPPTCTVKVDTQINVPALPTLVTDPALVPYYPAAAPYTAAHPCPRMGRYNFTSILPASAVDHLVPNTGYAAATLVVSATGVCTGSGHLGDGTAFAFSAPILNNANDPLTPLVTGGVAIFHAPLYAGKGRVTGTLNFDTGASPVALVGAGSWIRPEPPVGAVLFPLGITTSCTFFGSRYVAPVNARLDQVFDPNGTATLTAARPGFATVTAGVTLSTKNVFTYPVPNTNLVRLAVAPATGTLSGSVKFTGAPAASPIVGVLIHHFSLAPGFYGYIPGSTNYEKVTVKP